MAAGHQYVAPGEKQAGMSPARACHTGGPAAVRGDTSTLPTLEGRADGLSGRFLVFLRAGSGERQVGGNPSSTQDGVHGVDSVESQLLWHEGEEGTRRGTVHPGSVTAPRVSIRARRRALWCPGFHFPLCCLELRSPAQPSEGAAFPSPQLMADAASSMSRDAAHPTIMGYLCLLVILVFPFSLLREGTRCFLSMVLWLHGQKPWPPAWVHGCASCVQ